MQALGAGTAAGKEAISAEARGLLFLLAEFLRTAGDFPMCNGTWSSFAWRAAAACASKAAGWFRTRPLVG
jgi:hypothetical protein